MINAMPIEKTPEWLLNIASGKDDTEFPLMNILQNSLFYPACGLNGTPVKFLGGNIHSFIYADYGIKRIDLLRNLNGNTNRCGFKGYRSLKQMYLNFEDIAPISWSPGIVPPHNKMDRILHSQRYGEAFAHWSVWERQPDFPSTHGPDLFSFIHIGGEMSSVYQALYTRNNLKPKVLAIIQPGAFGGEWECVPSDQSFFKKVVKANSAGMPDYLLNGGYGPGYEEPCWNDYRGERLIQLPERSAGLWKLSNKPELSSAPTPREERLFDEFTAREYRRESLFGTGEPVYRFEYLEEKEFRLLSRYFRQISTDRPRYSNKVHGIVWERFNPGRVWNKYGFSSYNEFAFALLSWTYSHDDYRATKFILRNLLEFLPENEEIEQILLKGLWDREKGNALRVCFFKGLNYQFKQAVVDFVSVKLERFIKENENNERFLGTLINLIHRKLESNSALEQCKEVVLAYIENHPGVLNKLTSLKTKRLLDIQ